MCIISAENMVAKKAASSKDDNSANLFNTFPETNYGSNMLCLLATFHVLWSGKENRGSHIYNSVFHLVLSSMKVSHINP